MINNETIDLIKKHQLGNKNASNILLKNNMGLIYKIVNHYKFHPNFNFDDLVQEGLIGLNRAFDKFDLSKNIKISTYGAYWIKAYIQRWLSKNGSVVRQKNRGHEIGISFYSDKSLDEERDYLTDDKNPEMILIKRDNDFLIEKAKELALQRVNPKKYQILEEMLKNDMNATIVGEKFGMSRQSIDSNIKQIVRKIKRKIQTEIESP